MLIPPNLVQHRPIKHILRPNKHDPHPARFRPRARVLRHPPRRSSRRVRIGKRRPRSHGLRTPAAHRQHHPRKHAAGALAGTRSVAASCATRRRDSARRPSPPPWILDLGPDHRDPFRRALLPGTEQIRSIPLQPPGGGPGDGRKRPRGGGRGRETGRNQKTRIHIHPQRYFFDFWSRPSRLVYFPPFPLFPFSIFR